MHIFLYIHVSLISCNSESKTQTRVREVLVCGPPIRISHGHDYSTQLARLRLVRKS